MIKIKRLYLFMLQSFVPLFVMTFFICLFIVLMQFLWRYIDDLVGKGLGVDVIAELFFYAALTMIPMALPLAILLASLMTFGNLGERFELTAMKASGISLLKVMSPLIVLMVIISIAAFFFQNNVLPVAQTKMWTLLYSMRQKSPELEIPEAVFYDQIPGYNLYVEKKNRDTGTLYDIMIYDVSKGFDNASIILADSGRLAMTEDKTHLFLKLWNGESFENLKEAGQSMGNVPYRRETFDDKEILVAFDANFNRMDEEGMRNQYVGKNISELQATIDSVSLRVDSIGRTYGTEMRQMRRFGVQPYRVEYDSAGVMRSTLVPDVKIARTMNVDSMLRGSSSASNLNYINQALNRAKRQKQDFEFKGLMLQDDRKTIRRHAIELQKKFTLSFACIIFFFIGAPLGAIIRKGGLGMPLVISVFLFIFYFIIDNTGYKMAREGKMPVWEGMWLSSAVLLPLGIFFTYKAMRDSAVFNKDAYVTFFRRLAGMREKRSMEIKELVMVDVNPTEALTLLYRLRQTDKEFLERNPKRISFLRYWLKGYDTAELRQVSQTLESVVGYLSNSRNKKVMNLLNEYPFIRNLWLYRPASKKWVGYCMMAILPLSLPVYFAGLRHLRILREELEKVASVTDQLIALGEGLESKGMNPGVPAAPEKD
ncbi:MAG: LptF/LptG family permease [Paramuribaculum sp.]